MPLATPPGTHHPGPTDLPPPRAVFSAATCLGCGCLCDDIRVTMDGDRLVDADRACESGRLWFTREAARPSSAIAMIEGVPVEPERALWRAERILTAARRPVVFGLTRATTETVRQAIGLADRLGASLILDRSRAELDRLAAFQERGRVGATLGEVKGRADVVVYWGADPVTTHPRHLERYSALAPGRFVPDGRSGRTLIVIDSAKTPTSDLADLFVTCPPDGDLALSAMLRILVRRPGSAIGPGFDGTAVADLARRLVSARYGAIFYQPRQAVARAAWESVSALVRDLNTSRRFVLMGLGRGGNLAGAEAALTWQTGFAQGVDFGPGHPSPIDDATTLEEVLASGEADALLAVGDPWPVGPSPAALAHRARVPTIAIGPDAAGQAGPPSTVALVASTPGIDEPGTVTRSDGVVLPLRPLRTPTCPSARDWLARLLERLG